MNEGTRALLEHFRREKEKNEGYLRYAEQTQFRLCEITDKGEKDVSDAHRQHLREVIDEYQRVIDHFSAP